LISISCVDKCKKGWVNSAINFNLCSLLWNVWIVILYRYITDVWKVSCIKDIMLWGNG
jgi:hypothetical protein